MNIPNIPTAKEFTHTLIGLCDMLKALDAAAIDSADLVPMVQAIKSVAAYTAAIDAQIQERAIGNKELIPGVVVKDAVTHRKWHDDGAAEQLAQETFGDKAFDRSLKSPAQIEKMGDAGKTFVAMASYKPTAGKKVVY